MTAEPLFEATGTIEQVDAPLHDISQFGDELNSRHLPGARNVSVYTRAGSIRVPWDPFLDDPKVGDRVTIKVYPA